MKTPAAPAADVVVAGGGTAGCAAAIALRLRGVDRVWVVEAGRRDGPRVGESIPPDARPLLDALDVWPAFEADAHAPCLGSASSWGAGALGYNDFVFSVHGTGWHVDRRRFDAMLAARAAELGAVVLGGARLEGVARSGRGFRASVCGADGRRSLDARFLIDATGVSARAGRGLGARRRVHDQLLCITGFLELDAPAAPARRTLLEAVEYGWWYAAPLPGRRLVASVSSDPDLARRRGLLDPDGWQAALARTRHLSALAVGSRPGRPKLVTRPAPSFILDPLVGDGWLAAGDAASAYDPLSSQGIYKALFTAIQGASAAADWLDGRPESLARYREIVRAGFADLLESRAHFYGLERRWPRAPFWRRRQRPRAPAATAREARMA